MTWVLIEVGTGIHDGLVVEVGKIVDLLVTLVFAVELLLWKLLCFVWLHGLMLQISGRFVVNSNYYRTFFILKNRRTQNIQFEAC